MFKGLSVFFETYSITSNESKNAALRPIDVTCGTETSAMRVRALLERLGYGSMLENKEFKEIFASDGEWEVTASFIALPSSGTRIGLAVYSLKHRRTKKKLIRLMEELKKEFVSEII